MLNTAANEYRNLPLSFLTESTSNPRRHFEDGPLQELAESIRVQGVLSPLLVRPLTEQNFEIVAGARRFRAAQLAEAEAVPVRIVNLSDAEALEAQLIENLQRRDVHPLEEAQGFRALLNLQEPNYNVGQIAAKVGKAPSYVAQRLRLTELIQSVVEAFYAEAIGTGHALLLAKLQPAQQEQALKECFREEWAGSSNKPKRLLLPVKHLQHFIEHSLLLLLAQAPFSLEDAALVPSAGSCVDCPKRTGNNRLLFCDIKQDACSDPACYSTKVEAYVQVTLAAKPEMVRISTSYGQQPDGATALPRNKYVAINPEKPTSPQQAKWPEYKTCRFTKDALITDGLDKSEVRKVCANPECSIHHLKNATNRRDEAWKAEQEKRRREEAVATTAGLRVLAAITEAVPVRLLKRDLLFTVERLLPLLDQRRLEIIGRGRGIRAKKEENIGGLLFAFVKKADEGTLGRLLIEAAVLLSVRSGVAVEQALTAAAQHYRVDAEAITRKVNHEFAMRDKAKKTVKPQPKPTPPQKRAA